MVLHRKAKLNITDNYIDLSIVVDGSKSHYVYVKDFNRLAGAQCNKHKAKYILSQLSPWIPDQGGFRQACRKRLYNNVRIHY